MPLTPIQKKVLAILAGHRNAESHAGGGALINRSESSPRFSNDIDFFHDSEAATLSIAEADAKALVAGGFQVDWLLQATSLRKARVRGTEDELRIDWCHDTAFRFFPVQADADFGFCYHPVDVAINKTLAIAGRMEIRDFLDIIYLDETYLPLGALCWAACGKDQGYTPPMLLDCAKRNMCFREEDLAKERLVHRPRLTDVKQAWLKAATEAEQWCDRMPSADLGCLYLNSEGMPIAPVPGQSDLTSVSKHFGTVGGSWPIRVPCGGNTMNFYVGTSGYSYSAWKGSFYPKKLPNRQMLQYYGEHFRTVEINYTFRQLPTAAMLKTWADAVPAQFQFAVKAPQRITHIRRLKDVGDVLAKFLAVVGKLKKRLGPLLFQLPPNFKKDVPRLSAFLDFLPAKQRIAFEFRHASWFDDEVFGLLRKHRVALCIADADDDLKVPFVATTNWGCLRLRRPDYKPAALKKWVKRVQEQKWRDVFVYFRHEDEGRGPRLAKRFLELAE